ncbi:hypothetical protein Trydic_g13642 [Trypoxylus dichotomus]
MELHSELKYEPVREGEEGCPSRSEGYERVWRRSSKQRNWVVVYSFETLPKIQDTRSRGRDIVHRPKHWDNVKVTNKIRSRFCKYYTLKGFGRTLRIVIRGCFEFLRGPTCISS